ncbi:MAG: hypothetical protein R2761_11260 [Acidimicrobiales bacterium]
MPTPATMPPHSDCGDDGSGADRSRATAWTLALFLVGYNLGHHNSLLGSAAGPDGTRMADWIDLLTPFVVVLPLLWFLWGQRPHRRYLLLAAVGGILYVEGHGIHLSANSIGNAAVDDGGTANGTTHLWDEVVGHYVWYLGLAVLLALCARAARGRSLGIPAPVLALGGAACGITWATNGLEGGTAVFSLGCAVGSVALVDRRRSGLSLAVLAAGGVATAVLLAYGVVHGGFPQPSSL